MNKSFFYFFDNKWRKIFYLTAGVQLSAIILFAFFGFAEPLNLDNLKSKSAKTEIKNKTLNENPRTKLEFT